MPRCVVLVLAGGVGARIGGDLPKQYLTLAGKPVLRHAVEAFRGHPGIDSIRVVIGAADGELYADAVAGLPLPAPVRGGATRQASGLAGLEHLAAAAPPDRVLIHDAARPFVDRALVDRVLAALEDAPGAVPALPVADTLKKSDGDPPVIAATVERDGLWHAQTPQGFRFADILEAHRAAEGGGFTDDAAVAADAGLRVALVRGSEDNFKITTREDLARAERIAGNGEMLTRTGTGFDVHAVGDGDHVWLCGIPVPHERGLVGHSDADVALHAITDALLGAIAAGDIGSHFPPSDERWRNAPSRTFLEHAAGLAGEGRGRIVNVDVTIICETPKIGPHRDSMRRAVADILSIGVGRVSVKATTTERLGFLGRGEAIAAQASVSVALPEPPDAT